MSQPQVPRRSTWGYGYTAAPLLRKFKLMHHRDFRAFPAETLPIAFEPPPIPFEPLSIRSEPRAIATGFFPLHFGLLPTASAPLTIPFEPLPIASEALSSAHTPNPHHPNRLPPCQNRER